MKTLILLTLAGCLAQHAEPTADAPPSCASKDLAGCPDAAHDAPPIRDSLPGDAYVCTPSLVPAPDGCCVFAGTCAAGSQCVYLEDGSPTPSQSSGECAADQAIAEGGPCAYNNLRSGCAPGLYCAWNNGQIMQTGPYASEGTCRAVCDPTDTAAHGCGAGSGAKTCVGMPVCGTNDHFPDCPSVTTATIGYCL
jgi:hypothetical protein